MSKERCFRIVVKELIVPESELAGILGALTKEAGDPKGASNPQAQLKGAKGQPVPENSGNDRDCESGNCPEPLAGQEPDREPPVQGRYGRRARR